MKASNIIFSVLVLFLAVCALAAIGWGLTFALGMSIEFKSDVSDFGIFMTRVMGGVLFIGIVNGFCKLWDLFAYCMTMSDLTNTTNKE